MRCNLCNKTAELQVFTTFQYWYCRSCCCEVVQTANQPPLPAEFGELTAAELAELTDALSGILPDQYQD